MPLIILCTLLHEKQFCLFKREFGSNYQIKKHCLQEAGYFSSAISALGSESINSHFSTIAEWTFSWFKNLREHALQVWFKLFTVQKDRKHNYQISIFSNERMFYSQICFAMASTWCSGARGWQYKLQVIPHLCWGKKPLILCIQSSLKKVRC